MLCWLSAVVTQKVSIFVGSTCDTCINVPQPERAPFFNIPRSLASNKRDILCKTVRVPEETDRCLDLANTCDDFSNTSFSSSLTVCSTTPSSIDYQMCFSNITREMNNTKIHFLYSSTLGCPSTGRKVTSRLYIDSYEIIAQGTRTIIIAENIINQIICFPHIYRFRWNY